jgi:hypothetical protein
LIVERHPRNMPESAKSSRYKLIKFPDCLKGFKLDYGQTDLDYRGIPLLKATTKLMTEFGHFRETAPSRGVEFQVQIFFSKLNVFIFE